jgi:hypothetical protein
VSRTLSWSPGIDLIGSGFVVGYSVPTGDIPELPERFWEKSNSTHREVTPEVCVEEHGRPVDPVLVADVTAVLRKMDAVDWRGNWEGWFELLMACKSEGISLADWIDWCLSDPVYANDADEIARQWHSVEPRHGGALWRELSRRKIKVGHSSPYRTHKSGVTLTVDGRLPHQKTFISPSRRINRILDLIEQQPSERVLFSYSCLVAEIVHECGLSAGVQVELLQSRASLTPLWRSLGRDGVQRTIANAFRHVEERLLATPNGGQTEE